MEEATHLACFLVAAEATARIVSHANLVPTVRSAHDINIGILFVSSYALCVGAILLNLKDYPFFQSPRVRDTITFLHALDGFNAVLIGIGLYFNSVFFTSIGLICMTKLFLLYLLSRMVTGVKTHSIMSVVLQTTKTYIHHTGSFFFIPSDAYDVIIITSIWRFISMNGHAILTMRKKLSNETYNRWMWIIAHMRNAIVVIVLALCLAYPTIRHGFGTSHAFQVMAVLIVLHIKHLHFVYSFSALCLWPCCLHVGQNGACLPHR